MDGMGIPPIYIRTSEDRLAGHAIECEDPLFAIPILEIPDVEIAGLISDRRRSPRARGVMTVDCQYRFRHVG